MKYPDPHHLRATETSAPALARGLALWVLLTQRSPLMLEELASELSLPKASALRLLESLCRLGVVRRLEDKRFEPLWEPRSLVDSAALYREAIEQALGKICRASASTVEWYEPIGDGMELVLQHHPEQEVRVQVRPGFVRGWAGELEAVNTLGFAFHPQAPALGAMNRYVRNAISKKLPRTEAHTLITQARADGATAEAFFNTNGVRRCAVAARRGGTFLGVLALAEVYRFEETPAPGAWLPLLREHLPI